MGTTVVWLVLYQLRTIGFTEDEGASVQRVLTPESATNVRVCQVQWRSLWHRDFRV